MTEKIPPKDKHTKVKRIRKDPLARVHQLFGKTIKVMSWLRGFLPRSPSLSNYLELARHFSTVAKDRGVVGLIAHIKDVRTSLMHYLSGEYPSKKVLGVKVSSLGIPLVLKPFFKTLEVCKEAEPDVWQSELRILLTFLFCTRALSVGKNPSTSSITDSGQEPVMDLEHISSFWRALGFTHNSKRQVPRLLRWRKFHMTSKAGPNGPALLTALHDLYLIGLNPKLLESIFVVGGAELKEKILGLMENLDFALSCMPPFPTHRLRKLVWFPDKEVKTRVVAILDYFSQTALLPLHRYLYKVLKRIPQDCTFDQGSFKKKIEGWDYFASIDLTNATDVFPIALISKLLKGILPDAFVDAWEYIMVGLPFDFLRNGKAEKLSYARGTPMGAYTSWATFAVAHHYIIYTCCVQLGIAWESAKYCLLGDDVLFGDPILAALYKEKLKGLGVPFSPLKTHESPLLSEFAKRLFFRGVEVTPFPMPALEAAHKFYQLVPVFFAETGRGWNFEKGMSQAIASFYQDVLGFNAKFCKEIKSKAAVVESLMLCMRGVVTAQICVKAVFEVKQQPMPEELTEERCASLLNKAALTSFNKSILGFTEGSKEGDRFGNLSARICANLVSTDEGAIEAWSLRWFEAVPIVAVTMELQRIASGLATRGLIDLMRGTEWPILLKTIGLPSSDRVFVERQKDRLARGAASLAYALQEGALEAVEELRNKGKERFNVTLRETINLNEAAAPLVNFDAVREEFNVSDKYTDEEVMIAKMMADMGLDYVPERLKGKFPK